MACPAGLEITTPEECEFANTYVHWWAESDDGEAIAQKEREYMAATYKRPLKKINTLAYGEPKGGCPS